MSGLHAVDGSINISIVDGNTYVGEFAADGSMNVVATGSGYRGIQHGSGATNVTKVTSGPAGWYAADGSMNVSVSPYVSGSTEVTVVTGSFPGGGGTGGAGSPMGLLLALTYIS